MKTSRINGIIQTSGLLLLITLVGRLLSMMREMLLAQSVGMNAYTDAFNVSQSAIALCTGAIGATCLALVPILVDAAKEGERRRNEVFTSLFFAYMLVSVVIAIVLSYFAEPICCALGPGMSAEFQQIAADLLRIGFVKVNCVVGASLFAYYLQSREVFAVSGLSSLLSSAVVVVLLLIDAQADIYDYTRYTVYGFVVQLVVPLPFLVRARYRPRLRSLLEHRALKLLLVASIPLMGSAMFLQVQTLVGRAIATGFGEGAASSVDYANKIIQLVYASVTMSLNSVLFTRIAESAAAGDSGKSSQLLVAGGRNQLLLLVPLLLLIVFFGRPLIALLFQRGEFTGDDTSEVYLVLLGYLIGAWPYVFSDLFTKYFVSIKRFRTVNIVNALGYGISIVLVYPAAALFGTPGISLSFSLAQIIILAGFMYVFIHSPQGNMRLTPVKMIVGIKDLIPAVILFAVLEIWLVAFGEPGPIAALLLSAVFLGIYGVLLIAFRVRIGFKAVE